MYYLTAIKKFTEKNKAIIFYFKILDTDTHEFVFNYLMDCNYSLERLGKKTFYLLTADTHIVDMPNCRLEYAVIKSIPQFHSFLKYSEMMTHREENAKYLYI
jgi:hypothetical protein